MINPAHNITVSDIHTFLSLWKETVHGYRETYIRICRKQTVEYVERLKDLGIWLDSLIQDYRNQRTVGNIYGFLGRK